MSAVVKEFAALVPQLRYGYRRMLETKAYPLLRRPEALWNHMQYMREAERRPLTMHSVPSSVEIELTNRCNLACIQCLRSQGLKPYALGDVDFEDYKRMLAQFPNTLSLCLNGFGEPLMHARFFDIVAYTRGALPGTKITIYSNGMLLTKDVAERLIDSGLTEINVSIDAATPETYRKVRRGGELDVVHENIRGLVRARRERGAALPAVGINYVLLNENEGELVRFVEQAAELGVDFINCITYATYDWGFVNRRSQESYRRELSQARQRIDQLGLLCRSFPSEDLSWADAQRRFDCNFFWGRSLRITYAGELTLGCCTPFKETFSYGNILQTPFSELWNGLQMREFRAKALAGISPHPSCSACVAQTRAFFAEKSPELFPLRVKKRARAS